MNKTKDRVINGSSKEAQLDITPLLGKLDMISRCLGVLALRFSTSRPKSDKEKIHVLQALGFDRKEIAGILSIKPETVSVRLSEARANSKQKKQKRRGKN
jgi:DNA-directed RNA polymerase specialized sigma24 family protein